MKINEWFDNWAYDGISGFPNWKGTLAYIGMSVIVCLIVAVIFN